MAERSGLEIDLVNDLVALAGEAVPEESILAVAASVHRVAELGGDGALLGLAWALKVASARPGSAFEVTIKDPSGNDPTPPVTKEALDLLEAHRINDLRSLYKRLGGAGR